MKILFIQNNSVIEGFYARSIYISGYRSKHIESFSYFPRKYIYISTYSFTSISVHRLVFESLIKSIDM